MLGPAPLGMVREWGRIEIRPSHHMCHLAKYGRPGLTVTVVTEIRMKKLFSCVPHFKVTQGHRANDFYDSRIGNHK